MLPQEINIIPMLQNEISIITSSILAVVETIGGINLK
jgi:hypothetical protein